MLRDVGYVSATPDELMKYSVHREKANRPARHPEVRGSIPVQIQLEGEKPFCAQALAGDLETQKAAVDAAMKWRFKKSRGAFKHYVLGIINISFKN